MAIIDGNGVDITKVQPKRRMSVVVDSRMRAEKIQAALRRFQQNAWAINRTRLHEEEGRDFKIYGGAAFLRDDGSFQCTTNRTAADITADELYLLEYGTGTKLVKHVGNDLFFALTEDADKFNQGNNEQK